MGWKLELDLWFLCSVEVFRISFVVRIYKQIFGFMCDYRIQSYAMLRVECLGS